MLVAVGGVVDVGSGVALGYSKTGVLVGTAVGGAGVSEAGGSGVVVGAGVNVCTGGAVAINVGGADFAPPQAANSANQLNRNNPFTDKRLPCLCQNPIPTLEWFHPFATEFQ